MRFLKTFKKIFKALNTFYISRGRNEQASIKAGRKMAKIFEKEYLMERVENTTATVDNTNTDNFTLDNSTPIPVTINYDPLTNNLRYGIITSDRTYPNMIAEIANGVAI